MKGLIIFTLQFTILCCATFTTTEACGETITSLSGTIQSPNFPDDYSNSLNCDYVIKAPNGYRVTLNFTAFDIEESPECRNDYVELRDGDSETSPRIGNRLCTPSLPVPVRSFGNALLVRFVTNGNVTRAGFSASYTAAIHPESFFLIASTSSSSIGGGIFIMDTETRTNYLLPISPPLLNPIALTFDPVERKVYWTEVGIVNQVRSAALFGGASQAFLDAGQAAVLDGLALDPVSRLLFYADAGNKVIVMVTLSSGQHRTVVNTTLDKPRAIVLDTQNGVMYWTDWGGPAKIERANYDGSERRTLVSSYLLAVNALALDVHNKRLYWADAGTDLVEYTDLDGGNRTIVLQAVRTRHFFGLTLLDDSLYITDWGPDGVKTNLSLIVKQTVDGKNITVFGGVPQRLNDIHVYREQDLETNGCVNNNGGCSVFCIPLPGNRSKCTCPDGQSLLSDKTTCVDDKDLPVSSTPPMDESSAASFHREEGEKSLNVPLVAGAAAGGVVLVAVVVVIVFVIVRRRRNPLYDRPSKKRSKREREEAPYTGLGSIRNEPFVIRDDVDRDVTQGVGNPAGTRDRGSYSSDYAELDDTAIKTEEQPSGDYLHPTPCSWPKSRTPVSYIHATANPQHHYA